MNLHTVAVEKSGPGFRAPVTLEIRVFLRLITTSLRMAFCIMWTTPFMISQCLSLVYELKGPSDCVVLSDWYSGSWAIEWSKLVVLFCVISAP